jgi:ankyrin repeat protein
MEIWSCARLLLDWRAEVDPEVRWKETALHDAADNGHLSVVKLLVERGADIRFKNTSGWTAANHARNKGHKAVADWLASVSR